MRPRELLAFRFGFVLGVVNTGGLVVAILEPAPWSWLGWLGEALVVWATLALLVGPYGSGDGAR